MVDSTNCSIYLSVFNQIARTEGGRLAMALTRVSSSVERLIADALDKMPFAQTKEQFI